MRHDAARRTAVTTTPAATALAATLAATLAAAVALALPAAGSAARADTAPGPWAEQVCSAVAGWSAAAARSNRTISSGL